MTKKQAEWLLARAMLVSRGIAIGRWQDEDCRYCYLVRKLPDADGQPSWTVGMVSRIGDLCSASQPDNVAEYVEDRLQMCALDPLSRNEKEALENEMQLSDRFDALMEDGIIRTAIAVAGGHEEPGAWCPSTAALMDYYAEYERNLPNTGRVRRSSPDTLAADRRPIAGLTQFSALRLT